MKPLSYRGPEVSTRGNSVQSADRTPYSQDHRATTMAGSPLRIDEGKCYDENSLTELGPDEKMTGEPISLRNTPFARNKTRR